MKAKGTITDKFTGLPNCDTKVSTCISCLGQLQPCRRQVCLSKRRFQRHPVLTDIISSSFQFPPIFYLFSIALDKSLSTIKKALTSTLGNGHLGAIGGVQTCTSTTMPSAQNYTDAEAIVLLVACGRSDSGGRNYALHPIYFSYSSATIVIYKA